MAQEPSPINLKPGELVALNTNNKLEEEQVEVEKHKFTELPPLLSHLPSSAQDKNSLPKETPATLTIISSSKP